MLKTIFCKLFFFKWGEAAAVSFSSTFPASVDKHLRAFMTALTTKIKRGLSLIRSRLFWPVSFSESGVHNKVKPFEIEISSVTFEIDVSSAKLSLNPVQS